jgi:CBS domain-containing protein
MTTVNERMSADVSAMRPDATLVEATQQMRTSGVGESPVTCSPDEDISEVAERMRENEVQHLPVCEAGGVVGVISLADIAFGRAAKPGARSPRPRLSAADVGDAVGRR